MKKHDVKKFRFISELNTFITSSSTLRKFAPEDFIIVNKTTQNERTVTYVGKFYARGEFIGWRFRIFNENDEVVSYMMVYND